MRLFGRVSRFLFTGGTLWFGSRQLESHRKMQENFKRVAREKAQGAVSLFEAPRKVSNEELKLLAAKNIKKMFGPQKSWKIKVREPQAPSLRRGGVPRIVQYIGKRYQRLYGEYPPSRR